MCICCALQPRLIYGSLGIVSKSSTSLTPSNTTPGRCCCLSPDSLSLFGHVSVCLVHTCAAQSHPCVCTFTWQTRWLMNVWFSPDRIMTSQIVAYECYPACKDECTCSWYHVMFCVNIRILKEISFLLTEQAKVCQNSPEFDNQPSSDSSVHLSRCQCLMWQPSYVFLPKFIFFLWTSGSYAC